MPHFSRRTFLKLGTLTAAAALTACRPEAPEAPTLNLYNWTNYVSPDTVDGFSKTTGVFIHATEYGSNEELLENLKRTPEAYDLIVPSDYMVRQMIDAKLLQRLNMSLIPNFQNIQERFRTGRSHDPQSEYSVTKDWGTTGILWLPDRVPEAPQSWADFWALAPKYSGKIVVIEERAEVIGAALKLLGYSLNDEDPAHLAEAERKLMELRPHVIVVTDYFEMFKQKTVVMGLGWNGDAALLTETLNATTNYTIPAEGSVLWEDDWCIPVSAQHPKNAHTFINYVLQPDVAVAECNYVAYATVVADAIPKLDPAIRDNPTVFPPPEIMEKLEIAIPATGEALKRREDLWVRFTQG